MNIKPESKHTIRHLLTLEDFKKAEIDRTIVSGVIKGFDKEKKRFVIDLGEKEAYIKKDDFSLYDGDLGKSGNVLGYVKYISDDDTIYLDRRSLITDTIALLKNKLSNGPFKITSVVVKTLPFGCILDIGNGVRGFLPNRYISKCAINDSSDVLQESQEIRVLIESFDMDRLSFLVNYKDTLNHSPYFYKVGTKVSGIVRNNIRDKEGNTTGYFVEITPNICGIVDVSYLQYGKEMPFMVKSVSSAGVKLDLA